MDTNEIIANEEVIEIAEELAIADFGKGFKIATGIGLAVLAGVIAYKYIAKPLLAKIKAVKEEQERGWGENDFTKDDVEDIDEQN